MSTEHGRRRDLLSAHRLSCPFRAYQDFLALWENADLDVPILAHPKAEYAKLQ